MPKVLALDIATNTGCAFDRAITPGVPICRSYCCPQGLLGHRLKHFVVWLHKAATFIKPDVIAIEAPLIAGSRNAQSTRLLVSLNGAAHYIAACVGARVIERHNGSIKKFWTQNGKADKAAMMQMCRTLGWQVDNHDEADACALWAMVKAELEPSFSYRTTPLWGHAELQRREQAARAGGS